MKPFRREACAGGACPWRSPALAAIVAVALLLAGPARPCFADSAPLPDWVPRLLGAQFTYIGQRLIAFPAAYSGPNSLKSTGDQQATDTYGLYFGSRLTRRLQAYLDLEMARGSAVSHATGLGGLTNGDVIREGTVNLGMGPYVARAYLRYLLPLGPAGAETVPAERGMDHFPARSRRPASRSRPASSP